VVEVEKLSVVLVVHQTEPVVRPEQEVFKAQVQAVMDIVEVEVEAIQLEEQALLMQVEQVEVVKVIPELVRVEVMEHLAMVVLMMEVMEEQALQEMGPVEQTDTKEEVVVVPTAQPIFPNSTLAQEEEVVV